MTLTQTALLTKRLLLAFALVSFIAIAAWIAFIVYRANLPKPAPTITLPTSKFGILPQLLLPESTASASNYSFSIDTDTGDLPKNIPVLAKVYVTPQLGTSLLAADKAKNLAQKFGFTTGPEIISTNQHRYQDGNGGQITINLDTNNFVMFRTEASPSATSTSRTIEDQSRITDNFRNFLSAQGLLKGSLSSGQVKVTYNGPTQAESTAANITIWPDKLDNLEIVTPGYVHGLITAKLSKYGQDTDRYINLNYTYWEPDETTSSTYALKTPQTAFEDLKNNRGVIVVTPSQTRASITSIRLAYYEPNEYPVYIQPVYVFEGPNFVAYVPAVTSDYIAK